jgi:hypothetical protein
MNKKMIVSALVALGMACAVAVASAQGGRPSAALGQHSINDANRDGICDVCGNPVGAGQVNSQGQRAGGGKHFGPGDCTGNQGSGPRDGSGYGAQSGRRSGPMDGTGAGRGTPGRGIRRGGRS